MALPFVFCALRALLYLVIHMKKTSFQSCAPRVVCFYVAVVNITTYNDSQTVAELHLNLLGPQATHDRNLKKISFF